MRVSQRLFLAVIPAVVGVFTVAALAYWGELHRQAPEWVVAVAAVTAIGSLVLAWQNTRYVARRIERLIGAGRTHQPSTESPLAVVKSAALPGSGTSRDELDSIEKVVDQLSSAVTVAEAGSRQHEKAAAERMAEYAVLLDEASAAVRHQLDEARLALHILGEGHFGTLNENQAEMLAAASAGAEAAEAEMGRLQQIAELDRGALHPRRELIAIADLLRSLRPQLEAAGAKTGVALSLDLLPGLPKVHGDRVRLQQALELLLGHVVRHSTPGAAVTISAATLPGALRIAVAGGQSPTLDADIALARRIIEAHGGRIDVNQGETVVTMPTISTR